MSLFLDLTSLKRLGQKSLQKFRWVFGRFGNTAKGYFRSNWPFQIQLGTLYSTIRANLTFFLFTKITKLILFSPTCSHDVGLTTEVLRLECGKFLYSSHSFWNRRGGALTLGVPGPAEVPKIWVSKKTNKHCQKFFT